MDLAEVALLQKKINEKDFDCLNNILPILVEMDAIYNELYKDNLSMRDEINEREFKIRKILRVVSFFSIFNFTQH